MSLYLCPLASFLQVLTDAGNAPQVGCLIWSFAAGTSTPTATWTDSTGATPNSNPIQLNAAGRLNNVSMWQAGGVPIKVQFSTNAGSVGTPLFGVQLGPTFDQISGINDPAATLASLANANSGFGADLVANAVRSYDLVTSVRAANAPALVAGQTLIINVEGGALVTDTLGGNFYWNASSTATDDGINVLKPNAISGANPGRYLRVVNTSGLTGTFVLTTVGLTTVPLVPCSYVLNGTKVTLHFTLYAGSSFTGVSNSTAFQATGLPSFLYGSNHSHNSPLFQAMDNSVLGLSAYVLIGTTTSTPVGSTVQFILNNATGLWTGSGSKLILPGSFSYDLAG